MLKTDKMTYGHYQMDSYNVKYNQEIISMLN